MSRARLATPPAHHIRVRGRCEGPVQGRNRLHTGRESPQSHVPGFYGRWGQRFPGDHRERLLPGVVDGAGGSRAAGRKAQCDYTEQEPVHYSPASISTGGACTVFGCFGGFGAGAGSSVGSSVGSVVGVSVGVSVGTWVGSVVGVSVGSVVGVSEGSWVGSVVGGSVGSVVTVSSQSASTVA